MMPEERKKTKVPRITNTQQRFSSPGYIHSNKALHRRRSLALNWPSHPRSASSNGNGRAAVFASPGLAADQLKRWSYSYSTKKASSSSGLAEIELEGNNGGHLPQFISTSISP